MIALRTLLLALCFSLVACAPAAPPPRAATATAVYAATGAAGLPHFEIDAEGVKAALSGGSGSHPVLALDVYAGYNFASPPPDCYAPCTHSWKASFSANKAVLIGPGWCAATEQILASNLAHFSFSITVDGQRVPPRVIQSVTRSETAVLEAGATETPMYCTYYGLVAYDWPVGTHKVVVSLMWDQDIHDGWNSYRSGTYINEYTVTVTP